MPDVPFLMLFPYLRMRGTVEVGPWRLLRIETGEWPERTDATSEWIRALLTRLPDPAGVPRTTATLVMRRVGHAEPADPVEREHERQSLQAAVAFAVADSNARFDNAIDWQNGPIATAEVAQFFAAQMQSGGAFVRSRGGAINSRLIFGGTVFDDFVLQLAPEGLIDEPEVDLDAIVLNAVYEVDLAASTDKPGSVRSQIGAALHWHSRAWENSPLHTMPDVLVQLKTAIEALSNSYKTETGVQILETIYGAIGGTFGSNIYLWDPASPLFEDPRHNRTDLVSSFAHWYWTLAFTRNDIVHSTRPPEMEYTAPGSPFEGNLFQIAERVCRELIKIRLAQCGYPLAALTLTERQILDGATQENLRDQLTLIAPLDG